VRQRGGCVRVGRIIDELWHPRVVMLLWLCRHALVVCGASGGGLPAVAHAGVP
jgi:hypothetical protein